MKRKLLAAAAAAFFVCSTAANAAEFAALIEGTATIYDPHYFPDEGALSCPASESTCTTSYYGYVKVQTLAGDDNVYTGSALESVTFMTNLDGMTYHYGDPQLVVEGKDGPELLGMDPGAAATIVGGVIASLNFTYWWGAYGGYVTVGAFDVSDQGGEFPSYSVAATLTPVPEPANWALFVCGLGVAGAMSARRLSKPRA